MQKLRELIDTIAVMVGNFLGLRPTGWHESKEEAIRMRADYKAGQSTAPLEILDNGGNPVQVVIMSPVRYVFGRIMDYIAFGLVFYFSVEVVIAAFHLLVLGSICAALVWAVVKLLDFCFGSIKEVSIPAPSAAPASVATS